jgi:hypothetical protein
MEPNVCTLVMGAPTELDGILVVLDRVTRGNIHATAYVTLRAGATVMTLELRRGDRIVTGRDEWVLAGFRDEHGAAVVLRRYVPAPDQPDWDE